MRLSIELSAQIASDEPTIAFAMVEAASSPRVELRDPRLFVTEGIEAIPYKDIYGNPCRRMRVPAGTIQIDYLAEVDVLPPSFLERGAIGEPDLLVSPPDVLLYTLPSRYCPSDQFARMAQNLFGKSRSGYERVGDMCRWINAHIAYEYGISNSSTSAYDTVVHQGGVCRDFAHLGISFCRALNIPARYVSGYCLGLKPPDLHAYFQAYLGGDWIDFDATSLEPRAALIPIAVGRDAADCAWWTSGKPCMTTYLSVKIGECSSDE